MTCVGRGVVLFKPPDWEVHDENSELQLSSFMEAMFGRLKILRDEQHEHGPGLGMRDMSFDEACAIP